MKKDPKYPEAEFVTMTIKERARLVEDFGEPDTVKAIEKLNNYKGSGPNGKVIKYKSDYLAIRSWAMNAIQTSNGSSFPDYYDRKYEKSLDANQVIKYHQHLIKNGWVKNYSPGGTTWTKSK